MPVINYFWDEIEDNVVREYDEDNNTVASYTTEPTMYGSVLSQDRDGEKRVFHFDGLGNTTELTDETGNVTDKRRYTAFGSATEESGTTVVSYQWGALFGYHACPAYLSLIRNRACAAPIARWLSCDPLGLNDGVNLFRFAANNPGNTSDPSGLRTTFRDPNGFYGVALSGGFEAQLRVCIEVERVRCDTCYLMWPSWTPFELRDPPRLFFKSACFSPPLPLGFLPTDFDATVEGFILVQDSHALATKKRLAGHEYLHWIQVRQFFEVATYWAINVRIAEAIGCGEYTTKVDCEKRETFKGLGEVVLRELERSGGHYPPSGNEWPLPGQILPGAGDTFEPGSRAEGWVVSVGPTGRPRGVPTVVQIPEEVGTPLRFDDNMLKGRGNRVCLRANIMESK